MAGVAGLEPTNDGVKVRCLNRLGYTPSLIKMVSPQGFEPRTHGLEGRCSIQLSYEPILVIPYPYDTLNGAGDENRTHAISLEG